MEIEAAAAAAAAATLDSSSIRNGPRRNTNNNNVDSVTGGGKESGGGGDVAVAGYGGGCVGVMRGVYLVWEDLTVVLPKNFGHGPTKRLLNGLNGFAQPGRILAIMGPSGSGKSTLLDSLAGRLSTNVVMTGNILLNGKKQKLDYGGVAYVTQDDVLLGTLTVRETITYSANLRLPPDLTKEDITSIIEGTILDLGLQDCADRMIGNWHLRGVSGGERRRLSIALETLTRPQILFLDEPTSGLDSAASFFVVQILRNLAVEARTVIFSIHQPSSEVFSLFDDLYLLSGGDTVYFGDAKKAVEFFREAGFPCPSRRNPADHFLRCVNADFDKVEATLAGSLGRKQMDKFSDPNLMNMNTTEIRATLVEKFKWSEYAIRVRHTTKEISSISSGLEVPENQGSQASWWKQLFTLTRRSFKNMSRDLGYYWMRIATYIVVALAVGTIYYDVGTSYSAILARGACGGFVTGFMTFMSIGGFPSFIEEIKVYTKERHNGHYGVGAYVLSNFISSLPYLIAVSLGAGTVSFYMVKFRKGFSHFVFYFLNLFGCISAVESCMMVVASVVPNFMTGLLTGAGIIGITMMTSGFFRMLSDLPKVFWRYPISYISFGAWSVQGAYKNDLIGLEFDSVSPGGEKLQGADIIRTMFGIPMDHSKWVDLAALYIIVLCYRVLFFLVLKFKERASPVFRSLYAKKTMRKLKKRASFRKPAVFSSNRYHQPPQPLSAQEGLSSPIPYQ